MAELLIMLTGIVFLFNMTALSGKDDEEHLQRAQYALAAMQAAARPPRPVATGAGAVARASAPSQGTDAAAPDACAVPPAAMTFVRFCTATYAVCMGCMHDAVGILRQALQDSPMFEALAEANTADGAAHQHGHAWCCGLSGGDWDPCGPDARLLTATLNLFHVGQVHSSHRLLLLLVLCVLAAALAECDSPAARTEAEALQPAIQRIATASGNQADTILASLARARAWRCGREPRDTIEVGDPQFMPHRTAVLMAFQVSSEFVVPRTQLVIAALRALAPMLIATGCGPKPASPAFGVLVDHLRPCKPPSPSHGIHAHLGGMVLSP